MSEHETASGTDAEKLLPEEAAHLIDDILDRTVLSGSFSEKQFMDHLLQHRGFHQMLEDQAEYREYERRSKEGSL